MRSHPSRSLVRGRTLGLIGAWLAAGALFASPALADPKGEKKARDLIQEAMTTDYLEMNFVGAVIKLRRAIKICDKEGCTTAVHASGYRYLGTVLAAGIQRQEPAVVAFVSMLDLDPELGLDENFRTPEVEKAYDAAKERHDHEASQGSDDGSEPSDPPPDEGSRKKKKG